MRNQTFCRTVTVLTLFLLPFLFSCGKNEPGQGTGPATIGNPAPDFTLLDTKGRTWKLSDLKGKVIFVNFWATWCPPCRQEMPSMQDLYHDLTGKNFEMLAILTNDDPAVADTFAAKLGITFPILIDPGAKTAAAYGITGVPETFIIDPTGILREKYIGGRPWDSQGAKEMLGRYLR